MKSFIPLMAAAVGLASAIDILICDHVDLSGVCSWISGNEACTNFPGHLNDKVSSLDTRGINCLFYVDGGCTGNFWYTAGRHNVIPKDFNDKFSSVVCPFP